MDRVSNKPDKNQSNSPKKHPDIFIRGAMIGFVVLSLWGFSFVWSNSAAAGSLPTMSSANLTQGWAGEPGDMQYELGLTPTATQTPSSLRSSNAILSLEKKPKGVDDTPTSTATVTPTDIPMNSEVSVTPIIETPTPTFTPNTTVVDTSMPTVTAAETLTTTLQLTSTLTPTLLTATPTQPLGEISLDKLAVSTPGLPPVGPTNVPSAADPHVNYTSTTDSCAGCHRGHSAVGSVLRQSVPEEQVCFACHASGGTGTNVQGAFSNYSNTNATGGITPPITRYFKHDITLTNNLHQFGESDSSAYSGTNRHVECEDCHDPHEATRGSASPPLIQRVMNWVAGADPAWLDNTPGVPSAYTWLPHADREYQVCMKCHSSYTSLPGYRPDGWNGNSYVANGLRKLDTSSNSQIADSRNLAKEFNPNETSYHPVAALGRNQSMPSSSFVNGWSQTSLTYCSDCHTNANVGNQGVGPHGSPQLHILRGSANYTTVDGQVPASGELCFVCHNYSVYVSSGTTSATNFREGTDNLHNKHVTKRISCYTCHDTHGSEQLHLINFNADAMTFTNGRNSQTAWYATANGGGCFLACHGTEHNPRTYNH